MFEHLTVLKDELVTALNLTDRSIAMDCTAGGGGHTELMLKQCQNGTVIALDQDMLAMQHLEKKFAAPLSAKRLVLRRTRFSQVKAVADELGLTGQVDAVCADIGVSSPQLDLPERGFSFRSSGPLDMRMDQESGTLTAGDIVNTYPETELTRIFRLYGEEPKAHFVARAIVTKRATQPISDTLQLAELVAGAIHYKEKSKKHPATRVFQALRMAVNDELGELTRLIHDGFAILKPKGRLAIISFHSLEDRIVKTEFDALSGRKNVLPKGIPLTAEQEAAMRQASGHIVRPYPLVPSDQESELNPRARSAKLRVIEKL